MRTSVILHGGLSPNRCAVLVPFQGRIVSKCQTALLELERRGYVVRQMEGYSAIDQARNQMGSDALADGFQELSSVYCCQSGPLEE